MTATLGVCWFCMQDTSWLDVYLSDIPHVVYQVGDPGASIGAQHATLANKGNEAMAYLQFILDYWERLPAAVVFLHGHRCAHMAGTCPGQIPAAGQWRVQRCDTARNA